MLHKTIAAISTPVGPGGIGIIRISGAGAKDTLVNIFKPYRGSNQHAGTDIEPRKVYYGFIVDPHTGDLVDEAIVFFMPGPKSYTREDVVEVQSHSGYVVLDQIFKIIIELGVDPAGPGEFTQRAFLNGRIDLGQAEAIIDKINAVSIAASQLASQQMTAGIGPKVALIIDAIRKLQARYEASIEFSGDDPTVNVECLAEQKAILLNQLVPEIKTMIQRQKETEIIRKGLHITISGIPNAGKSSLLNKLTERESAIVSEYPGTTRDVIRDYVSIDGLSVVLSDTAGIHTTDDPVENLGIKKAQEQIEAANIVLLVVEANRPLNEYETDWLHREVAEKTIVVINKIDLASAGQLDDLSLSLKGYSSIPVSAKSGQGIDRLKRVIFERLMIKDIDSVNAAAIPNLRQAQILRKVLIRIEDSITQSWGHTTADLEAGQLAEIAGLLTDISGDPEKVDIYDEIFSQFCIGK